MVATTSTEPLTPRTESVVTIRPPSGYRPGAEHGPEVDVCAGLYRIADMMMTRLPLPIGIRLIPHPRRGGVPARG